VLQYVTSIDNKEASGIVLLALLHEYELLRFQAQEYRLSDIKKDS
jgi:hypothetical protein